MQIEKVSVDSLLAYERNQKKHSKKQVKLIAGSIREFGFLNPIIVDGKNEIIAGHGRLEAAKELGLKEVPVLQAGHLSEEQVKAYRIADNKLTELGEWDEDLLSMEIKELSGGNMDLELLGFDESFLDDLLTEMEEQQGLTDPDEIPEKVEPVCEEGDLWQLGKHRLLCGDSTKREDVERLMGGGMANMVFTDPPYGVSYVGINNPDGKKWEMIKNDDLRDDNLFGFLYDVFKNIYEFTTENISLYIWHASGTHIEFETALRKAGFEVKQQLIWKKGMILGHSDYHWAHELVLYCKKQNQKTFFYGDRKNKTIIENNDIDVNSMSREDLLEILEYLQDSSSVWEINRDNPKKYKHPTQKPIALAKRALKNSSKVYSIVLDLFLGSGSTLIACQESGRICYGMELDPKYCDVIIQRWENFTGKKACKVEG